MSNNEFEKYRNIINDTRHKLKTDLGSNPTHFSFTQFKTHLMKHDFTLKSTTSTP